MSNSAGKFGPYDHAGAVRAAVAGLPRGLISVSGRTGVDLVRSRIALRVRLGLLGSGQRLPDAGVLAEELGISEITVRRALETMCQDGLLDRRRGRAGGTFIAREWEAVTAALYDPRRAAALEDFHLLLECGLVARQAGEVRGEALTEGLDELAALVDEMDALGGLDGSGFGEGLADGLADGLGDRPGEGLGGRLSDGPGDGPGEDFGRTFGDGPDDPDTPEGLRAADAAGLLRLETLFHLELARLLGGSGLDERVADLLGQLCLLEAGPTPAQMRERNRRHAQLLDALATDRMESAVAALKAHGLVGRETADRAERAF